VGKERAVANGFPAPTTGPVRWQRSSRYNDPLLFVIPSEAEGSAVLRTCPGNVFARIAGPYADTT
jgi:hypothetical protein